MITQKFRSRKIQCIIRQSRKRGVTFTDVHHTIGTAGRITFLYDLSRFSRFANISRSSRVSSRCGVNIILLFDTSSSCRRIIFICKVSPKQSKIFQKKKSLRCLPPPFMRFYTTIVIIIISFFSHNAYSSK